ncbi:hypothetical protein ACIQXF_03220 [Lysinibacillus sp. NPDC097231]|uniref:hypothetical protein n=1 Tax=Lysinibacillus sp. NPDC097231 TaxID=3364142 RepID=UPI003824A138
MNDKKKGKLQVSVIVIMILLLVAAFVLFFKGHYSVAFVLFGIFIVVINFISNWLKIKNEDYVYRKNFNNNKW